MLPVFCTSIVKVTVSPSSTTLSLSTSVVKAHVLSASIDALAPVSVSTKEVSSISFPEGSSAVTTTVFLTNPESEAACSIVYCTLYVALSPTSKVPSVAVFDVSNVGVSVIDVLSPSIKVSTSAILLRATFPVLVIVIM